MSHIEQAEQQAELQKRLWAVANDLRGNMDASEYRNYILGLIFYRFLSEKVENYANELLQDDDVDFADAEQDAELMQDLKDEVIDVLGFFIEPRYLFTTMVKKINAGDFDVEMLQNAINEVQNSTLGKESENDFKGLFEDLDLQSSRLGNTVAKRSELIAKVILSLSNIDFGEQDIKIDILGDAYEYLIGQFAASAGKKAGEFYTPQQVSKLLARIVMAGKDRLKTVYDPTMGSGSLLLQLGNYATIGN
ncbi:Site-specific DNA-methyltransferase (adenine-specific) [Lactiplantibacillus plantarum subsp. plantarum]|uniref:site-specific DNA-methyltransferase (adenine-specific) n=1 Tax=Lactiplantibacillus plantarum subsp. plantarum TaxID=337330 RepID=A0A2S3U1S8_LACPN|nr:Site-specific DNA-methyltransferase (adenine-specific) [Lactiplantibacillus plantarum subsp. plantarum]